MKKNRTPKRWISLVLCLGLSLSALPLSAALAGAGTSPQQVQAAPAAATNGENYLSAEAYQAFGLSAVNNAASQPTDFTEDVADPLAEYHPMELSELYVASMNRSNAYSGDAKVLKGPDTFSADKIKLDNMDKVSSHSYASGMTYQAQNATAVSYASSADPDATEGMAEFVLYTSGGNSYQKITLYDSQMKELSYLEIPISDQNSGDWVSGIEADSARGLTAIAAGRYFKGVPCIAAYVPSRRTSEGNAGSPYILIASVDTQKIVVQQKIYLYDVKPDSFGSLTYEGWYLPVVDLHTTGISGDDDLVINACLPYADQYADRGQSAASVIYSNTNVKGSNKVKKEMAPLFNIPMSNGTDGTRFAAACDADLNGNGVGELVVAAHRNKKSRTGKGTMLDKANAVQIVTWDPAKKTYQFVWQHAADVNKIENIEVKKAVTEPVAVTAGRYFTGDNKDYLFFEGITFQFKDAFPTNVQAEADYFRNNSLEEICRMSLGGQGSQFVSHAVTACFTKDRYGTEQTVVVSGAVTARADKRMDYDVSWVHGTGQPGSTSLTQTKSDTGYMKDKSNNHDGTFLTITGVDVDQDAVYLKYKGKRSGWSAPTPVVVLPATPYYEEMLYKDGYDAGSVSFTMSSGQGQAAGNSWNVGGRISMGLQTQGGVGVAGEQAVVGGVFEDELLLSALRSRYNAQNIATSVNYKSDGGEANVVCAASPMTSYLYEIWIPEYTVTAKMREEYKKQTGEDCPFAEGSKQGGTFETFSVNNLYNPQYSILSVDQYNQAAQTYGTAAAPVPEIDMKDVYADYVPGAPDTYPKTQADLPNVAAGSCHEGGTQSVSTGAAQKFLAGDDQTTEYRNGFSLKFNASLTFIAEAKVSMIVKPDATAQGSGSLEIGREPTWISASMNGQPVHASISKLPAGADAYGFSATPALWRTTALTGQAGDGKNPYVFGFLADGADAAPPTVPDMWVYDTQLEPRGVGDPTSYITLCWDSQDGTRPAEEYEVLQVTGNTATPVGTTKTNMLTVEGLPSGQPFTFQLRAVGAGGAESIAGRPLQAASQPKEHPTIAAQPQNARADVGGSATFTVDARPGTPGAALYYQWQRFEVSPNSLQGNWKNLTEYPVEGQASYTLENVQAKDNNAKLRVVVYQTPTVNGICPMVYSQEAGLAVGTDANACTLQLSFRSSLMDYNTGHDTTLSAAKVWDNLTIAIEGLPDILHNQNLYLLFVDETGTTRLDVLPVHTLGNGPNVSMSYDLSASFQPGQSGEPALQKGRVQVYAIFSGTLDLAYSDPTDPTSTPLTDAQVIERLKNFLQTGDPSALLTSPISTLAESAPPEAPSPEPTETPAPTDSPAPTETQGNPLAPQGAPAPLANTGFEPCYATAVINYHYVDEDSNSVEVSFETGRGDNSPLNIERVTRATPVFNLFPAEVDGGRFLGWYADAGHSTGVDSIGPVPLDQIHPVLYAAYEDTASSISYHLDGGTNNPLNPDAYTIVSPSIGLREPEKAGYRFTGWFTDAGLTAPIRSIAHGSVGDIDLYAGWEVINYNIYYTAGDGSVPDGSPKTYTVLDAVSPGPPQYGGGSGTWYTDSMFTQAFGGLPAGSTGTLVLYGKEPGQPDTPSTPPDQPGSGDNPGKGTGGGPKTGDDTLVWPYIVLAVCAVAAIIGVAVYRRRKVSRKRIADDNFTT